MQKFVVRGGTRLVGEIEVSGAKNAALPIMAACLLSPKRCLLRGIPALLDIDVMRGVLELLGAKVVVAGEQMLIDAGAIVSEAVPRMLTQKMRASNLVMGPLLGRFGRARISAPGGCAIGERPMDLHLKGFEALGAKVRQVAGETIEAEATRLRGAEIHLDIPSVGATENIMMAAVLAEGTTIIRNAAREPEIVDLQNFLNGIGGRIRGAGSGMIRIDGVSRLGAVEYKVMPDRIECGTHMVAAAMTRGDVFIRGVIPEHVEAVTAKLQEVGAEIRKYDEGISVCLNRPPKSVDLITMPYPGFPTDMQPQMMALMCLTSGTSRVTETIFEKRFQHVEELRRMGGRITVDGRTAIIEGVRNIVGTTVRATDLRAGACLLLAGMAASGVTTIEHIEHLERGYAQLDRKYNNLGARILRTSDISLLADAL